MVIKILAVLTIAAAVFAAVVATRPADFRITRTAVMSAPAPRIFAHVNDLHKWEAWSPWAKIDPNAKSTYEGSPSGPGALMRWDGNNKVGAGSMAITESRPGEFVKITLEFLRPFAATNLAEFAFKPEGHQTEVTWSMSGRNNFMSKAFGLFVDCDKMVGGDFEKGLAQLKTIVEKESGH